MSSPDVLVTGATGFLGRVLVTRLRSERRRVRVFVRHVPAWLLEADVDIAVGDLDDAAGVETAVGGVAEVHHLGATTRGRAAASGAGSVRATMNVIDACLRHQVRRLIYVSSLSVLEHAGRPSDVPITESSALEPHPGWRGAYTQAKVAAEQAVRDAVHTRGLRAVLIRPGQIVGPRAKSVVPNGTFNFAGMWIAVGNGDRTLPLVYVDDVVDALLLAATQPNVDGRTFHIVDPEPVTHAEYIAWCRRGSSGRRLVIRLTEPVAVFGAGAIEAAARVLRQTAPLTRYRVRSLRTLAGFDLAAARTVLGWTPRVGIREGLRRTFG